MEYERKSLYADRIENPSNAFGYILAPLAIPIIIGIALYNLNGSGIKKLSKILKELRQKS